MFIQVKNAENENILINMDTISLIEPDEKGNLSFIPTESNNNLIEVTNMSVGDVLWLLSEKPNEQAS